MAKLPASKVSVGLVAVVCTAVVLAIGASIGWHQANRALEMAIPTTAIASDRVPDNLAAEQWMATWAMWMFIATIVQIFVGAVGLFFVVSGFNQARDAARLAQKTYAAERRTWMELSVKVLSVKRTGDNIRIELGLEAENSGSTPATDVTFFAEGFATGHLLPPDDLVDELARSHMSYQMPGPTVMPSRRAVEEHYVDAGRNALADERSADIRQSNMGRRLPDMLAISVFYGVCYRSLGSEEWNFTGGSALVRRTDNSEFAFDDWEFSEQSVNLIHFAHRAKIA